MLRGSMHCKLWPLVQQQIGIGNVTAALREDSVPGDPERLGQRIKYDTLTWKLGDAEQV